MEYLKAFWVNFLEIGLGIKSAVIAVVSIVAIMIYTILALTIGGVISNALGVIIFLGLLLVSIRVLSGKWITKTIVIIVMCLVVLLFLGLHIDSLFDFSQSQPVPTMQHNTTHGNWNGNWKEKYEQSQVDIEQLKAENDRKDSNLKSFKKQIVTIKSGLAEKIQKIETLKEKIQKLKDAYGQQPKASCDLNCIKQDIRLLLAQAKGALKRGELDKSDDLSFDASLMINQFLKDSGYTEQIRKIRNEIRIARQLRIKNSQRKKG